MPSTWLDELNPQQRAAATADDGPLLVVAGAGTGTRTLAARVAHLLERGVDPHRVLLLTFTRRAAAEMLARARWMSGRAEAAGVWGGTFHAIANRLLRVHAQAIGLSREFTVIDQSDAADLLNLIRNERGLASRESRFPRKATLLAIYSRMINAHEKLEDVLARHFPWCRADTQDLANVFDDYVERKRRNVVLDYDDLLLYWDALCGAPSVGERVGAQFEHILVDEYQDTNHLQSQILRGMRRTNTSIMAVGDDAQAVYSFRAATVRNMLDFADHFPGARAFKLEENYRSRQSILDASNAVIAQASERYTKDLWSGRTGGEHPVLLTCESEAEQSNAVCANVLAHREQGIELQKQAVLFRAGHHSAALEVELNRRNIPYHKFGGLKFVEAAHVKDLVAILRILENPHDEISWHRILLTFHGIGPKYASQIIVRLGVVPAESQPGDSGAGTRPSPLRLLIEGTIDVPAAAIAQFDGLRELVKASVSANGDGEAGKGSALVGEIERAAAFYASIAKDRFDNWQVRLQDLEQLGQIAARYRSRSRFISDLTLDPPAATSDLAGPPHKDEEFLILSTIHSAKGLEWDAVHIIHAADGMIPSDMAIENNEGVEEERRLLYVAMTRARDWLYAYVPLRYYKAGNRGTDRHQYAQPSRFFTEKVRRYFTARVFGSVADDAEILGEAARVDIRDRTRSLWRD